MTSNRQVAANRANASRSTGPKSKEGKIAVRLNASKHGLLARDVVLPDEDANAFETLRNAILSDLAPSGPVEEFFADRAINSMWRLSRLERTETAIFHWRRYGFKVNKLKGKVSTFERTVTSYKDPEIRQQFAELDAQSEMETVTTITDEAAHTAAKKELGKARFELSRDETLLGRAFNADASDADTFGKLSRYETSLERSLLRNLEVLRRLQRERQTAPVMDIEDGE